MYIFLKSYYLLYRAIEEIYIKLHVIFLAKIATTTNKRSQLTIKKKKELRNNVYNRHLHSLSGSTDLIDLPPPS